MDFMVRSLPGQKPAQQEMERVVPTGTVKWFAPEKGYGFISRDDGEADLFVHRSEAGFEILNEGDRVDFTVGYGNKGANALGVRVVERGPGPQPRSFGGPVMDVDSLPLHHGVVKRFDTERGFGFISPDDGGDDVFVHRSAFGSFVPPTGQRVSFRLGSGQRGPRAEAVQMIGVEPGFIAQRASR